MELEDEDQELYMKEYNLLTYKPVIYAANVSEDDLADDAQSNAHVQRVREYAAQTKSEVFALCAEIEQEISELEEEEKKEFLEDLARYSRRHRSRKGAPYPPRSPRCRRNPPTCPYISRRSPCTCR